MSIAGRSYSSRFQFRFARSAWPAIQIKLGWKGATLLILFLLLPMVIYAGLKLAAMVFEPADGPAQHPAAVEPQPAAGQTVPTNIDLSWTHLEPVYRSYEVIVEEDSSLKLNGRPARLYGFQAIPRQKICTYANGERWACGQRAYVALINVMGRTTVDCREKNKGAPMDINAPRTYTCQLPGTDLTELMLKEGWGTVQNGVSDPRYWAAAAAAQTRQNGMWRPLPTSR